MKLCISCRYVNRRVESEGFFLRHIVTFYECFLVDSADNAEWSVENHCRINGMIDILVCIWHGNRSHCRGETSPYASDSERYGDGKTKYLDDIVVAKVNKSLPFRYGKHLEEDDSQCYCYQWKIPIWCDFFEDNEKYVALSSELLQYVPRGSAPCKGEISAVAEVCSESYHAHKNEQSPYNFIVKFAFLFPM